MRTIKIFKGKRPPLLKKGEWATDGTYAYLGMQYGGYKVFQGVFDLSKSQQISGFQYDFDRRAIIIPSGTPFSKLQRLFNTLPKSLKYHTNEKASIDILFEDGTFINDLGTWMVLRDFSYQINLKSLSNTNDETVGTYEKPVVFQSDHSIEVYNSAVNFSDIRFEYSDPKNGAITFHNSTTFIDDCCFHAKVNQPCVTDKGYNKIVFSDTYFRLNSDVEDSLLDNAAVGSIINVARCKCDETTRPKTIVKELRGGFILAGNVEGLHIAEKSPLYIPNGGVEIHGGLVTNTDGGLDVAVPSKLSQLENDLGFSKNYEDLENKPTTITTEQAKEIEANTKKISYSKEDADKLKGIEEKATVGATAEQAEAIKANSEKRGYPQKDEDKLKDIEEKATAGATAEQAKAIEANTKKISYPKKDADKLKNIQEKATVGADWETNVKNKPDILGQLVTAFDNAGIVNLRYFQESDCLTLNFKDGSEKNYPQFLNAVKTED